MLLTVGVAPDAAADAARAGARPNHPSCLLSWDGAVVSAEECALLARTCILFDAGDAAAMERARDQWRHLTGAGIAAEYWSEESGRWQRKR